MPNRIQYKCLNKINWSGKGNRWGYSVYFLFYFLYTPTSSLGQVTFEKYYRAKEVFTSYNISQAPYVLNTSDSGYYLFTWNGEDTDHLLQHWLSTTRLNKKGEVLWSKNSDSYATYEDFGYGGLVGTVRYLDSSFVMLWNDAYLNERTGLIHFDKNGNSIWGKKYIYPPNWGYPYMNNIAYTLDNGIIGLGLVTDDSRSNINWVVLMKTDSAGNMQWCKRYLPDSSYGEVDELSWVMPTADSGFLVTFQTEDSVTYTDGGCLMKVDANGNLVWIKEYYGISPGYAGPQIINKNIYLAWWGNYTNYIVFTKTDMHGVPILSSTYTNSNAAGLYYASTLSDGSILMSIVNIDGTSSMLKVDSSGNILWANNYGLLDTLYLSNLDLTLDNGILGYGVDTKAASTEPFNWQLIKTDAMGRDGCETPVTFTKTPTPLTWKNSFCYVQNVALTVKDTLLNFNSVIIDTSTVCSLKYIQKPIAKIYELNDTICNGFCLCFNDSSSNNPISWKWQFAGGNPSTSILQNPCNICYSVPGKYIVKLVVTNFKGSDSIMDSVIVIAAPLLNIAGKDSICLGDSTKLTALPGGLTYLWNTYNTNESIYVAPSVNTYYYVKAPTKYCLIKDSIDVIVPIFNITACCDTTINQGQTVQLNSSGGASYLWSPSSGTCNTCSNPIISPLSTTIYTVTIISSIGCLAKDSLTVIVICRPVNVCCDSLIARGGSVQLISSGGNKYYWSPSSRLSCDTCNSPIASPLQSTIYTVTVNDSGCISTRTVKIDVTCGDVFVPDAFSPNQSVNNMLYVRSPCIASMDFMVFDRWGNKVFETQNQDKGWDGTYNGQPLNIGTYVWYLNATLQDGASIEKKGNVILVR